MFSLKLVCYRFGNNATQDVSGAHYTDFPSTRCVLTNSPNESDSKICPSCGKAMVDKLLAILSDAPADVERCRCFGDKPSREQHSDENGIVDMCQLCKKRISEGRKGSFTQWIFRHDLCSCENPQVISVSASELPEKSIRESPDPSARKDEREMVVEEKGFPRDAFKPIEFIAAGGVGRIYKCRSRQLGFLCAVKTLRTLTPEHLVELQQEAIIISKLNSENILKIFDFGLVDETYPFMVTEYVQGETLKSLLKKHGAIDYSVATEVFIQICNGLAHAHQKGIFHRDVSSNNVIVNLQSKDLIVKLIDFGLSMSTAQLRQVTTQQGLTIVGTAAYMSPDQLAGQVYDARSEIYSLGCLMYETLVGQPPFCGVTPMDILAKHSEAPVPHFRDVVRNIQIPSNLEAIIRKCLEKNKEDRYQTVEELKSDINDTRTIPNIEPLSVLESGVSPFGTAVLESKFNGFGITGGAIVLLVIVTSVAYIFALSEPAAKSFDKSIPLLRICSDLGNAHAAVVLADKYMSGKEADKDVGTALELYHRAAKQDIPDAYFALGRFNFDRVHENSLKSAERYLSKAAELGHVRAKVYMSFLTNNPDEEYRSSAFLRQAASQGDAMAKCLIATSRFHPRLRYPEVRSIIDASSDLQSSADDGTVSLMREAAEAGIPEAQFNLGLALERALGCQSDLASAKRWYLEAARQGDPDAQYRYAHLLEMSGSAKYRKSMVKWYERSANQDNRDACIALLRCLPEVSSRSRENLVEQIAVLKSVEMERSSIFFAKTYGRIRRILKTKLCPPTFVLRSSESASVANIKPIGAIGDSDLVQITTALPLEKTKLTTLNLLDVPIEGSGLLYLKHVPLSALSISTKSLTNAGFSTLAEIESLKTLVLYGPLREDQLHRLVRMKVHDLRIRNSTINGAMLEEICQISSLERLELESWDSSTSQPANLLLRLPRLRKISLSLKSVDTNLVNDLNRLRNIETIEIRFPSTDMVASDFEPLKQLKGINVDLKINSTSLTESQLLMLAAIPAVRKFGLDSYLLVGQTANQIQLRFPEKVYRYMFSSGESEANLIEADSLLEEL